jgi:hypothetical protein
MAMTSHNRWFSRAAYDHEEPVRNTAGNTSRKAQQTVPWTAYGKGLLFFLQIHITGEKADCASHLSLRRHDSRSTFSSYC